MKRKIAFLLLLVMLMGMLAGCKSEPAPAEKPAAEPAAAEEAAPAPAEESVTRIITDWNGREVEIPQKIESVVCVAVGTLRFTTYLQAENLLAGVEEHEIGAGCTRPFAYVSQDDYEGLPLTGNNGETYDEAIIAADPDVIVTRMDADTAEAYQKKIGIPVVSIPLLEGILDDKVFFAIDFLGELYGHEERAKELGDYLRGIQEDIDTRMAQVTEEPTVYVAGVAFRGAHGFEGTESNYGPLTALKAKNIADDYGEGKPFDMDIEEVLKRDPDYIFICNEKLINEQYAQNPDFFNGFSAVQNGNLYSQISYRSCATNTEMAIANMYYMGKVLFPEQFEDIDPIAKTNEIVKMFLGVDDYYSVLEENGYYFGQVTLGN